ncbi:MAG TPA: NADP-dependent phosphogluconate dehydrogenase [Polyangiaceae bacterium]|nr:NADP-dependent phosphogluconate dehydrogenase [Polyangiaceae bacterium]
MELDVGMLGLGVMGQNLALNLADKGFTVAGYDAWPEPVERFSRASSAGTVRGFHSLPEFVASLSRPRRIILLVKAGEVVDKTLAALTPLLEPGDTVIDGGNEFFRNTERRASELGARGLRFFGMGVSGGEEGARHGPSLMPGGDRAEYDVMQPMLEAIAAKADGACVTYVGPGGSGHFVKMVHNGIEYADMQLIAEAYDVLRTAGFSNAELADTFAEYNRGELESFLIEITASIFRKADPEGAGALIDVIADGASMKGTGKWTVQQAAELGAPVPTIAVAVDARVLSSSPARAQTRVLPGPVPAAAREDRAQLESDVRAALYAAKACAYAQGMALLRMASDVYGWSLNLSELARIWTGGCIIRARFLGRIKEAFLRTPDLSNLLLDGSFQRELGERQAAWRRLVAFGAEHGLPLPAHASALAYYDTLRRERLPQNLTQAQRDYFGAHTYQRIDKPGSFHSDWAGEDPANT